MTTLTSDEPYLSTPVKHQIRLTAALKDESVSQELTFYGQDLRESDFRRRLHDALDSMIYRSLAANKDL